MIFLILILALILRLVNLSQSLWLDEAVQAITSQNSIPYIFQEITGDFHPPLYYFLMHFWVRIFGSSEVALRLPSVLFGIGTVYILYKIAMFMHGKFIATLAAVLLATAPFHVYYSQEARMYSMVTFFASLSFYCLLTPEKSNKNKYLYFIFTLLMLFSDYYGFLVLLAQGIYLITKKNYKFLLICLFACFLIYLPWVPMLITQLKTGLLATQTLPGWGKLANISFLKAIPLTFIKFTIGRITIFDRRVYAVFSVGLLALIGVILVNLIKSKVKNNNYFLITALWFVVPLIVAWIASLFIPNFQPFRLLLILPAFYLLLATGMKGKMVTIATILIINLISLSVYFFNPYFQREDWKGLVKYFNQQDRPKVILPSSASNWPIKYYDKNGNINLITGSLGALEVNDTPKIGGNKKDELYYIRYLVEVFDPQEKILSSLGKEGYTKIEELSFNQIFVLKFQKK